MTSSPAPAPTPGTSSDRFDRGRAFLLTHGRVLERRLAEVWFPDAAAGAHPEAVRAAALAALDALTSHRNADGGFAHGLEPDTQTPHSQPLAADFALTVCDDLLSSPVGTDPTVRARIRDLATAAAAHLAEVASRQQPDDAGPPGPSVPLVLPDVLDHPRASHVDPANFPPGLNPTCGLAARLHLAEADHPWPTEAIAWAITQLGLDDNAHGTPDSTPDGKALAIRTGDAHSALNVLRLLEVTGREEAHRALGANLHHLHHYQPQRDPNSYGLTPLQFAPTPDSPSHAFFTAAQLDADLDALAADQQPDGGWPLTWQPPGPIATAAYRGAVTLSALRTLRAYGR
jgi:hypothetical protein